LQSERSPLCLEAPREIERIDNGPPGMAHSALPPLTRQGKNPTRVVFRNLQIEWSWRDVGYRECRQRPDETLIGITLRRQFQWSATSMRWQRKLATFAEPRAVGRKARNITERLPKPLHAAVRRVP
jgi:hypothetical protein